MPGRTERGGSYSSLNSQLHQISEFYETVSQKVSWGANEEDSTDFHPLHECAYMHINKPMHTCLTHTFFLNQSNKLQIFYNKNNNDAGIRTPETGPYLESLVIWVHIRVGKKTDYTKLSSDISINKHPEINDKFSNVIRWHLKNRKGKNGLLKENMSSLVRRKKLLGPHICNNKISNGTWIQINN